MGTRSSSNDTSVCCLGRTSAICVFSWRPCIVAETSWAPVGKGDNNTGDASSSFSPLTTSSAPRGLLTISRLPVAGAKSMWTSLTSPRPVVSRCATGSWKRCSRRTTRSPGRTASSRIGVRPTASPSMNTRASSGPEVRLSVAEPRISLGPTPSAYQSAITMNTASTAIRVQRSFLLSTFGLGMSHPLELRSPRAADRASIRRFRARGVAWSSRAC